MSEHSPEAPDRPAGKTPSEASASPAPQTAGGQTHRSETAHVSTPQVEVDVEVKTPDGQLPSRERVVGAGIGWLALWSGRWILIAIAVAIL